MIELAVYERLADTLQAVNMSDVSCSELKGSIPPCQALSDGLRAELVTNYGLADTL